MVNKDQGRPVGVFDSGLGGLTVVSEIWRRLPREQVLYFGDTARVPYGGRPTEEIRQFNREVISFLVELNAKAIVVACNTSSSLALEMMRREFELPLIGVIEPGANAAAAVTRNGVVGLLATEGTVRSGAYERAIRSLRPDCQVVAQACPLLVPLIESGQIDSPEVDQALAGYIQPLTERGVDTIILGCTHYPFLADRIRPLVGRDVALVNPAEATAVELHRVLASNDLVEEGHKKEDRLFTSGDPVQFRHLSELLLKKDLPHCEHAFPGVGSGLSVR